MMETMRNLASGFIAKILMGLLVLSFAVWGIADMFSNYGSGAVAKVGKTEIDARNYQSELILEINALSNTVWDSVSPLNRRRPSVCPIRCWAA